MKRALMAILMLAALTLVAGGRSARASDILYVGDDTDNTVKRFDADTGAFLDKAKGAFVTSGSGGLLGPMGLIFSPDGELLVSNQNVDLPFPGEILRYSRTTGAFLGALIPHTLPNAPPAPRGLVLFKGDLFVPSLGSLSNGPGPFQEFTASGTFVTDLSKSLPPAIASVFHPRGVVIGPDGLLYVSNDPKFGNFTPGGQVVTFDPATGKFKSLFINSTGGTTCNCTNELNGPEGLVFSPDGQRLYITSFASTGTNDSDKIIIFDAKTGAFLGHIELDSPGNPPSPRAWALTLLFGPGGKLFVPITGDTPLNGATLGPFTGEVRRYDVSTKTFDVLVPPNMSGGPVGSGWYLTFGGTNPATLQYKAPAASPTPTPIATPKPTPSATPTPGPAPVISSIPAAIKVGDSFNINGSHFSAKPLVNFFVATGGAAINAGPLTPSFISTTLLTVPVPATKPLGEGFVTVEVINTDQGFKVSNQRSALLQGAAAAGIPTLESINGVDLAATSSDPSFATNNVETVILQGSPVKLGGTGFDATHGVAVNVFSAAGNKGPVFVNPGAGLSSTSFTFTLPPSVPTGPASLAVVNKGSDGSYSKSSNAVSVPVGNTISVTSVHQAGNTIIVNGTGFSTLTVINFFNSRAGGVVNLGGLGAHGPKIPFTLVNSKEINFTAPAAAVSGPAYVQMLNPPYVPYTSSGTGPGGGFGYTAPAPTPTPGPCGASSAEVCG